MLEHETLFDTECALVVSREFVYDGCEFRLQLNEDYMSYSLTVIDENGEEETVTGVNEFFATLSKAALSGAYHRGELHRKRMTVGRSSAADAD